MNDVEHLIVSNSFDFTSDYICYELQRRGQKYLRINRDRFSDYCIFIDLCKGIMNICIGNNEYQVKESFLKSIYFRAPVFLRDSYNHSLSLAEQLYRSQWSSFIRNLIYFEDILWMNNPVSTYKAENKILQLKYASQIGFEIPQTFITNEAKIPIKAESNYIVKSLDTALFRKDETELFVFSNIVKGSEIRESNLMEAPIILQEYIYPKIDLRVTVIGEKVHAVKIVKNNEGIEGDWRKHKDDVQFIPYDLPKTIINRSIELVKKFNLSFGAIDLVYCKGNYYFIEINPTGEWAWLVENANQRIDIDIVDMLTRGV
ncbi:ATP-grasp domain-containing protein [Thermoanaerobacterium butyriciformans]|uniref:Glutathione synthase/RimK-type ligase-like ATP-grasp enzyme n=1 Tax=Thermoanaerobacterium butyriciformans TaxID=1702242 RepID=A0ABS4NHK8_9THEO|nr:glutathione synthase/RimK-type ligase-like ATP-grasp enzyme [Thermoanaerobacterium butyriciformans]